MRIGVDIRCLMDSRYSGISEYAYHLLNELFLIDKKNQYILFYNAARAIQSRPFTAPNIEYCSFRYPNRLFNLGIRFLKFASVDKMLGGVDVFIMPNFLFINLSSACKKLLIVHDVSFERYPSFFTAKQRLWHALIGPRLLCRRADAIIAISKNTARDIVELYGVSEQKISVIYPGVADIFYEPISPAARERVLRQYDLRPGYIFSLGNLEPRKNITTLLSAFGQLTDPSAELVIAGAPSWKYRSLYRQVERSANRRRIKFIGYVDAADRPALYANASMLVYPSIYEGFGLPPLEAMAVGTPVISSTSSSLVEAVGDAGILVDPYNVSDLAQAITALRNDQLFCQELSRRGQARAATFRWQRSALEVLAIISRWG